MLCSWLSCEALQSALLSGFISGIYVGCFCKLCRVTLSAATWGVILCLAGGAMPGDSVGWLCGDAI